jgi:hypothetical protein
VLKVGTYVKSKLGFEQLFLANPYDISIAKQISRIVSICEVAGSCVYSLQWSEYLKGCSSWSSTTVHSLKFLFLPINKISACLYLKWDTMYIFNAIGSLNMAEICTVKFLVFCQQKLTSYLLRQTRKLGCRLYFLFFLFVPFIFTLDLFIQREINSCVKNTHVIFYFICSLGRKS